MVRVRVSDISEDKSQMTIMKFFNAKQKNKERDVDGYTYMTQLQQDNKPVNYSPKEKKEAKKETPYICTTQA